MKKVFSKHKWIEWAGKEKYLEEKNQFKNVDAVFWVDECDGKTALECDELGILINPDWMIELTDEDYEDLQEVIKREKEIDRLLPNIENNDNNFKEDIDDFEQFEYRTEQENAIYEKTKAFGRTQFVREIASQINSNKKLENDINLLKKEVNSNVDYIDELQNDLFKLTIANKELHNKIDKAIEFIKKAQYDDELKSYVYGLNATGTRNLLEILKDSGVDDK